MAGTIRGAERTDRGIARAQPGRRVVDLLARVDPRPLVHQLVGQIEQVFLQRVEPLDELSALDLNNWHLRNKCGERYHRSEVFKRMRQIAAAKSLITKHVRVPVARYQSRDEAA
jgi:hypothetical protein